MLNAWNNLLDLLENQKTHDFYSTIDWLKDFVTMLKEGRTQLKSNKKFACTGISQCLGTCKKLKNSANKKKCKKGNFRVCPMPRKPNSPKWCCPPGNFGWNICSIITRYPTRQCLF